MLVLYQQGTCSCLVFPPTQAAVGVVDVQGVKGQFQSSGNKKII
jgi:hypothetical protein